MRLSRWAVALLVALAAAALADAARSRIRVSSRSIRVRYSYRSYRYTYYSGALYSRRLTPSIMGPLYYSYASRYPMYFNYRRTPIGGTGDTCRNYQALSNGSYIGTFSCPFLPDEPSDWTRCCGYENEEFCCDPAYDDSWKLAGLSVLAMVLIVIACLVVAAAVIAVTVFCCCVKKRRAEAASAQQSQPFMGPAGKQVDGSKPIPPPYPTVEYGTIPVQPQAMSGQAPYPLQPMPPPYPPPYGSQNQ